MGYRDRETGALGAGRGGHLARQSDGGGMNSTTRDHDDIFIQEGIPRDL